MLVDQFDVFLLDLDGVVYVGDTLLSGVTEALASLRSRGRVVRFVTNDPRPSRKDVVHRLGRLGVRATVEEIVSSGWATACWLRQQGITRAYVVGCQIPGLVEAERLFCIQAALPMVWFSAKCVASISAGVW
ncbi:hypothetical protein MTQ12_14805 [Brevibacterium sp. R8603A2]|uniref:hypothetical protein n=1 Tax=Brevibacterium sp. R8603A2 TaxID=2929779 RepID=UPI001FFA2A38|nr:hypothetical protein [Brevibacterium sp. R8603A2]